MYILSWNITFIYLLSLMSKMVDTADVLKLEIWQEFYFLTKNTRAPGCVGAPLGSP